MPRCNCCYDEENLRKIPRKPYYQKQVDVSIPSYGLVLGNRLKEDGRQQRRQPCTAPVVRRGEEVPPMPCPKFTPVHPDEDAEDVFRRRQRTKYCAMTKEEYEKAACRDCSGKERGRFEKDTGGGRGRCQDCSKSKLQDRGNWQKEAVGGREENICNGCGPSKRESGDALYFKKEKRHQRTDERSKKKGTEYIVMIEDDGNSYTSSAPSIRSYTSKSSQKTTSTCSSTDERTRVKKGDKVTVYMPCSGAHSKVKRDAVGNGGRVYDPRREQLKERPKENRRSNCANSDSEKNDKKNLPEREIKEKNYAYRCASRELIGSKMIISCDCVKRNGLQDQCRRTPCRGNEACLQQPWPDCWPSGGCLGINYNCITGVARYNPVMEYRQDNKRCRRPDRNQLPTSGIKLAFQPSVSYRRHRN